jgi:folate-dependent phosphoribosylglycinamide formyltransferase PurN
MVKKKTCIFISGKGSNLRNLISRSRDNNFPIKISLVICNNMEAYGVNYAKKNKVPYIFVDAKKKIMKIKFYSI